MPLVVIARIVAAMISPRRKSPSAFVWCAIFAFAALGAGPAFSAARQAVDLELVIATDVSPSIDEAEARLQREGIAEAFLNPQVVQAIQAGSLGRIGVAYIDFSSRAYNKIVLNWQVVRDKTTAAAFASALRNAPPSFGRHTSISEAIGLASLLLEANDLDGTKKAIDISGDGPNNWGPDIALARNDAVAQNITINGLPILGEGAFPGLDRYFSNCVIGGKGAFIVVAQGFQDFARAIRNKLILEIASASEEPRLIRAAEQPALRFQPAPRGGNGRPLNQEGCENRFGFGPFGGFDFPPPR